MRTLRIFLMALAFISFHAYAKDDRNLAVNRANNAASEQRIALVIGNGAYTNSPLKNPVNDAKDMAQKLRSLGFDVIERSNLHIRQIGGTLREFRSKLVPGSVALVFYAGHGLQIKGINYLPAVDADINSEEDVPNQSLSVNQIMDVLDESKTRLNLVFLDACRNNPYARSFRSADKGLARVSAPSGTLISYATRPGSIAADGSGRNGLYTSKLLTQMDSNIQIEQVLKQVVTAVKVASEGKQEPWMEGSIEGDFCFGGCAAGSGAQVASLVPVPAQVKTKEEIEDDTWNTAEAANTAEAIKAYLAGYPKGRYVSPARVKLATLKKSSQETKPAELVAPPVSPNKNDPDAILWSEAQKGNTVEDYQVYVDSYPKGKYLPFAKARIKKLNEAAQAAAEQQQQQAWDIAQQENSEASYSLYLRGYPNGRFAGLAKVRHEKLKNDLAAKEEAALWNKAETGNDKAAVETYLNRYPSGRYLAAASAKLQAIKEEEAKGPAMVRIPGKNYELGKYEVTQGEWKAVMGNNPSNFSNCGDTCPVEQVSWNDIQEYLQKLNAKTGRQYRLPSEAEWEYACYGGSQTEYCGGSNIDSVAWYAGNSNNTTHPAGQKQANGYGLYDMSGNVWEWMENCYESICDGRAVRGGSWGIMRVNSGSALRFSSTPALRESLIGFRVARTLPSEAAQPEKPTENTLQSSTLGGNVPAMVRIPGKNYELGKYEVTQKEWRDVMGSNPSRFSNCGDTCPVEQVSWNDIQEFLQKLNSKTGKQYRLPTETEWEYACYGGSQSEYCGGSDINSVAWYKDNSGGQSHPVGQKQANGYGLHDMSGNLWEWHDCYNGNCSKRAVRGGSWDYAPQNARAAIRPFFGAGHRDYSYGFRLARTLP